MATDDAAVRVVTRPQEKGEQSEPCRKATLGNVRLRHQVDDAVILVPTPSSDPNDPLNWFVVSSSPIRFIECEWNVLTLP